VISSKFNRKRTDIGFQKAAGNHYNKNNE